MINKIESINKILEKAGKRLKVENIKDNNNLLKTPPANPKLPSIRAKSSIRPSRSGDPLFQYCEKEKLNIESKPKSRMGMIKLNSEYGRNELSESKDFELFFQKELLPKELQKVNPMLLGLTPGTPMRTFSPVCREVTEEEKDIIKMKYKLSKMNSKLNDERKTIKQMMTRMGTPKLKIGPTDFQKQFRKATNIYRFSKLNTNIEKNRNNSCISPQPQIRFSEFNNNLNSRGATFTENKEFSLNSRNRVFSCDKSSEKLSSVSENSDADESTTKNVDIVQQKQVKNMKIFMKNHPKKGQNHIKMKRKTKAKLNKTQIQVVSKMISSKLKFDINHSNFLKKQKNKRRTIVTNLMHRRNFKSVSPRREDSKEFTRNNRMQTTLKP